MPYYYDSYGWLVARVIADRATEVTPPAEVPEGHRPNFTGHKWINMPYVAPEVNIKELQALVEPVVDKRLDDFAQTRGYLNVNSLAKYQNISDAEIAAIDDPFERGMAAKFRMECRYLAVMTARTWGKCYGIMGLIMQGDPVPTLEEFLALLPPLKWPDEQ